MPSTVILASRSRIRAEIMAKAGIAVVVEPADIDETSIKAALSGSDASAAECAVALAEAKAMRISHQHREAIIIGADQILELDGVWYDKPGDFREAIGQLRGLRGKRHTLSSAVVAVRDSTRLWHTVDTARLTMRRFSDEFLEHYLTAAGAEILSSVGAYQYEAMGAQLFDRVEGDYFTIMGLPLLPVLGFLRDYGVVKN